MTISPITDTQTVAVEELEKEFAKPEWQSALHARPLRHLHTAKFPPSEAFPAGGDTLYFEIVDSDSKRIALVAKNMKPDRSYYDPEIRPQALLVGDKWLII